MSERATKGPGGRPQAEGTEMRIHIGELVIDGGTRVDRAALAAAMEGELGRLVAAHGLRPAQAIHARIDAGTLRAPVGDSAAVGRGVARAVHRTLGGER